MAMAGAAPRRRRREQLGQTDIRLGWESSTTGETMDRHAYIDERLAQIPLFKDLSKKDLRRISGLATRLEEPAGKVLIKEGQQGYEFIIVLEGEVEVRQHGEVIAKRGAGDYFGEIALLDNRPRTATIVATTPVVIEVIERREFLGLVAEVPEIGQAVMATMAQRLAELDGES
jgi:CRP/FNR family transcriptional regulator, cyclic AMP receptor protein